MLNRIVPCLVLIASLAPFLSAQSAKETIEPEIAGGPFLGGGGFFNLDRNTNDLALEMGGMADFRIRDQLGVVVSAGFMANVSDNNAFADRSGLLTGGIRYSLSSDKVAPFVTGGYALSAGEGTTHHFGFAGGGIRYWYGEKIGVQFELRDYITSDINFLQGRISVLLR